MLVVGGCLFHGARMKYIKITDSRKCNLNINRKNRTKQHQNRRLTKFKERKNNNSDNFTKREEKVNFQGFKRSSHFEVFFEKAEGLRRFFGKVQVLEPLFKRFWVFS